jgi:hypothetical protein
MGEGRVVFIKQRIAIVQWAEDHEDLFDDRTVLVTGLYLLGALALGAVAWKAIVIAAAAYALMIMRIAPRLVGVLGVMFFLVAMAKWAGIAEINALATAANKG